MCSCCGSVKETLLLSERTFICDNCGMVKDRDRNAADNLENYGRNKIGMVNPESTPMDKEALVYSSSIGINKTTLEEVGISECSEMNT
jgi:transposase